MHLVQIGPGRGLVQPPNPGGPQPDPGLSSKYAACPKAVANLVTSSAWCQPQLPRLMLSPCVLPVRERGRGGADLRTSVLKPGDCGHAYANTYRCTHRDTCTDIHARTWRYPETHGRAHACTSTCKEAHADTYVLVLHINSRVCLHTDTRAQTLAHIHEHTCAHRLHTHTHTQTHAHIHEHIQLYLTVCPCSILSTRQAVCAAQLTAGGLGGPIFSVKSREASVLLGAQDLGDRRVQQAGEGSSGPILL